LVTPVTLSILSTWAVSWPAPWTTSARPLRASRRLLPGPAMSTFVSLALFAAMSVLLPRPLWSVAFV